MSAIASSTSTKLPVVSSTQTLNQAVGTPLADAKRFLKLNGTVDYKIDTAGINQATLAKTIQAAVQSGKIDLNVSPAVFDARTGSQAGSQIKQVAEELKIKTANQSVKQLIAAIGDKTVGSKAGSYVLPGKVLDSLGGVSLAALVSTGDAKLNALGIKTTYAFKGGELRMEVKGSDKTGVNTEFAGKVTATDGTSTGTIEGRFNTQGGTAASASLDVKSGIATLKAGVAASTIKGETPFKAEGELGLSLGKTLLTGNIVYRNTGKAPETEAGITVKNGEFSGGISNKDGGTAQINWSRNF